MCIGDNWSDRNYADAHDTYFIKAGTAITKTMNLSFAKLGLPYVTPVV